MSWKVEVYVGGKKVEDTSKLQITDNVVKVMHPVKVKDRAA